MVSQIDPTVPQTGINQPVSVIRQNFLYAKQEIEDLQSQTATILSQPSIKKLQQDTSPILGGNLDVATFSIISSSNRNINISPNGTGKIKLDGLNWPSVDGSSGQILSTDGNSNLSWVSASTALLENDPNPRLSNNLDAQNNRIINLATPVSNNDAVTKVYVDSNFVSTSSPTLDTNLDAQSNKIINLNDPTNPQDAATKSYVDSIISQYEVHGFVEGMPNNGQIVVKRAFVVNVEFAIDFSGSIGGSLTSATALSQFAIKKNGVTVATMDIQALTTTATFICPTITTFNVGDILEVEAPLVQDASLSGVYFTLFGTRI